MTHEKAILKWHNNFQRLNRCFRWPVEPLQNAAFGLRVISISFQLQFWLGRSPTDFSAGCARHRLWWRTNFDVFLYRRHRRHLHVSRHFWLLSVGIHNLIDIISQDLKSKRIILEKNPLQHWIWLDYYLIATGLIIWFIFRRVDTYSWPFYAHN